jgi:hypothetical protein
VDARLRLSREAFGERIADFQNTRFLLADMATTVDVMWAYIDRAMELYKDKKLTAEEAAKVKFWATDREAELLDIGVQLHGGYGYITEYPIARAYLDARVHRIYGGTNEIMRDLVCARSSASADPCADGHGPERMPDPNVPASVVSPVSASGEAPGSGRRGGRAGERAGRHRRRASGRR